MGFSSARNLGRDISAGFSPPRRMPISEAVKKFMRVPKGAGNSVPWDPELTPDPAGLVYWCRHPPDVPCLAETGCGIRCYQATPRS